MGIKKNHTSQLGALRFSTGNFCRNKNNVRQYKQSTTKTMARMIWWWGGRPKKWVMMSIPCDNSKFSVFEIIAFEQCATVDSASLSTPNTPQSTHFSAYAIEDYPTAVIQNLFVESVILNNFYCVRIE